MLLSCYLHFKIPKAIIIRDWGPQTQGHVDGRGPVGVGISVILQITFKEPLALAAARLAFPEALDLAVLHKGLAEVYGRG